MASARSRGASPIAALAVMVCMLSVAATAAYADSPHFIRADPAV
jgi:hypothetical protein